SSAWPCATVSGVRSECAASRMKPRSRSAARCCSSTASWRRRTCQTMPRNTHVMSGISDSSERSTGVRSIAIVVTATTASSTPAVCPFVHRRKPYRNVIVIQIQWNGTVCHCGKTSIPTAQATQKAPHASSPRRSGVNDIAQVAHRADDAGTELVAQAVDADVDDVRMRVEVHLPDVGEQLLARARPAGAGHQVPQHAELALGQLDRGPAGAEVDATADEIEREPARAQVALGVRGRRRAAAQLGA